MFSVVDVDVLGYLLRLTQNFEDRFVFISHNS
jgi:hypothetical protein